MATTVKRMSRDRWVHFPSAWETYLKLLKDRGERQFPHYIYVKGRLTIVSPGFSHDFLKKRLAWMIEEILLSLSIPFMPAGSTTLLKSIKPRTGIEPDECYYLTNIEKLRGKDDLVMSVDPSPDLAVEVAISHPVKDALAAYRILGVREVWVCKRSELAIMVLGEKRTYARSAKSRLLSFLSATELTPWIYRDDLPNEMEFRRLFRDWVAQELLPRHRDGGTAG